MEILLYVGGILFMLVGVAVSIALHEIGHLVPAKLFGVRVGQYMIGFGPRLFSFRRGETEYGVKALPIGGFISMSGMYPPPAPGAKPPSGMFAALVQDARAANAETIVEDEQERTFYRLPVWKRVIVMLGGPLMNLFLAVLIFTVLLSGVGVQQGTTTISAVSECVLPAGSERTQCESGDPAAPAAAAGLQPGDRLVSIDGTELETFDQASALIQASPGRPLSVVVERAGTNTTLSLTPVAADRPVLDDAGSPVQDAEGNAITQEVGYAGVQAQLAFVPQPLTAGPEAAANNIGAVASMLVTLPARLWDVGASLFTGAERDPDGPLSVVGVGRIAGEVAATDTPVLNRFVGLFSLLGSLNVALFVFNLIPLLPLDGGHVVVALWEGLRRRVAALFGRPTPPPVDATRLVPLTVAVAVLLIGMGGLLLLADLFNPVELLG